MTIGTFVNQMRRRQFVIRDATQRLARNSVFRTNSHFGYVGEKIATHANYTGVIFAVRFHAGSPIFTCYCANIPLLEGVAGPTESDGGPVCNITITKIYWPEFNKVTSFAGGSVPRTENEPAARPDLRPVDISYNPEQIANRCRLLLRAFGIKAVRKAGATLISACGSSMRVKWAEKLDWPVNFTLNSKQLRESRKNPIKNRRPNNRVPEAVSGAVPDPVRIAEIIDRESIRARDIMNHPIRTNYYVRSGEPVNTANEIRAGEAQRAAASVQSIMQEAERMFDAHLGDVYTPGFRTETLMSLHRAAEQYLVMDLTLVTSVYNMVFNIPGGGTRVFTASGTSPISVSRDHNDFNADRFFQHISPQGARNWNLNPDAYLNRFIRYVSDVINRIRHAARQELSIRNNLRTNTRQTFRDGDTIGVRVNPFENITFTRTDHNRFNF